MEQIKTLEDIHNLIHRMEFNNILLAPNVNLRIELNSGDYVNILKELMSTLIMTERMHLNSNNFDWLTYCYMGHKVYLYRVEKLQKPVTK